MKVWVKKSILGLTGKEISDRKARGEDLECHTIPYKVTGAEYLQAIKETEKQREKINRVAFVNILAGDFTQAEYLKRLKDKEREMGRIYYILKNAVKIGG